MRIRCKLCDTILDTKEYQKKKQKYCECEEIALDWHGKKVNAKNFNNIDTLGDEKMANGYKMIQEYYDKSNEIAAKFYKLEITYEEWKIEKAKLHKEFYEET